MNKGWECELVNSFSFFPVAMSRCHVPFCLVSIHVDLAPGVGPTTKYSSWRISSSRIWSCLMSCLAGAVGDWSI